jgi:NNP family nitrate/nitrite transporter-like MFS transporter
MLYSKAEKIHLLDFKSPQMRSFHMAWMAFFLSFLAWYGLAPLMPIIRQEMSLTKGQIGDLLIAAVSLAVPTRIFMGWCCDKFGPRLSFGWLMIVFSLPIMGVVFAKNFESLLIFRLLIGGIGASFVIAQFHSTMMFAPKCVGTANATTAGWGNMGGGMAQVFMPFLTGTFISWGATSAMGWRLSMVTVGAACLIFGILYLFLTQDTPAGNFADIPAEARKSGKSAGKWSYVLSNRGVWVLVIAYGACFGVELTMKNILVLYYTDYFDAFKKMTAVDAAKWCGLIASGYGFMNIFARTLGGWLSDKAAVGSGITGRAGVLFGTLLAEGICLILFSRTGSLVFAIPAMMLFAMTVQMACGATYAITPFVEPRSIGRAAGLVGAGGNIGAMAIGFLFKTSVLWPTLLMGIGLGVALISVLIPLVRFSEIPTPTSTPLEPDPKINSTTA